MSEENKTNNGSFVYNGDTSVKFIYDESFKTSSNIYSQKTKMKPPFVDRVSNAIWNYGAKAIKFTFITIPEFVGQSVIYVIENVSRVFRIQIGIFNAEKLELCATIVSLKEQVAELRADNKDFDEDNYLLTTSNYELMRAGLRMHDELVNLYGESNALVAQWRDAERSSKTRLNLPYDESSKYLSVRQRRSNQEYADGLSNKKYTVWSDSIDWTSIYTNKKDPQRGSSKVSSTKKKAAKKKSKR